MIQKQGSHSAPLADRMRPRKLEDFFGQGHIVGQGSLLQKALEQDTVPSMLLWGPPGTGKTTLASIVAAQTNAVFISLSGVLSGKNDLLDALAKAQTNKTFGQKTILFIDEIHRWNKAQQDALLPAVERGDVIFIGATTENPSFEVISALVSRTHLFVLSKLSVEDITKIILRTLEDNEHGLGGRDITIDDEIVGHVAAIAHGDARAALNILEAAVGISKHITKNTIERIVQNARLYYDKVGDEHYNIISALHKSMRGGDPHAALYWLARMLEGGEDPLYLARRLVRFASEDVGLADNFALVLANSTYDVCHKLGMPECNVHLAHLVIYLAQAKKSIRAYVAYGRAKKDVKEFGNLPVPLHICNAPTKLMEKLGYAKGYKYTPVEDSSDQEYMPDELKGKKYF
ncbi:MAG: ATPase, AAA family protein [candidate division TM6 bacterium GW2011_GWE2_41_16]|nr:MAG: ATPase, AAA family protein [candidate division TM6 bacterium GW2011_GWE2_41_16]